MAAAAAGRQMARRLLQSSGSSGAMAMVRRELHHGALSPASRMIPRRSAEAAGMLRRGAYAYSSASGVHSSSRGFMGHLFHEHWDAFRSVAIDYGFVKLEPLYQIFRALFLISLVRILVGDYGM